MTKILVCGGREFGSFLWQEPWALGFLDGIHAAKRITCVVHGAARGADQIANDWARMRRIRTATYPADWQKHGKAAGPIRNQLMLDENPDIKIVVAFPGGRGTADMIKRAKAAGIITACVNIDQNKTTEVSTKED